MCEHLKLKKGNWRDVHYFIGIIWTGNLAYTRFCKDEAFDLRGLGWVASAAEVLKAWGVYVVGGQAEMVER